MTAAISDSRTANRHVRRVNAASAPSTMTMPESKKSRRDAPTASILHVC